MSKNMLRITLDEDEADFLVTLVRQLTGGEELTEREQLILLLGVRFMQRRDHWVDVAVHEAVADAIKAYLRPECN